MPWHAPVDSVSRPRTKLFCSAQDGKQTTPCVEHATATHLHCPLFMWLFLVCLGSLLNT